jgi:hypothetical protein
VGSRRQLKVSARSGSHSQALAAQTTASNRTRRAWELGEALGRIPLTLRNLRQTRLGEAQARIDALQASALVRIDAHALWHSKGHMPMPSMNPDYWATPHYPTHHSHLDS